MRASTAEGSGRAVAEYCLGRSSGARLDSDERSTQSMWCTDQIGKTPRRVVGVGREVD